MGSKDLFFSFGFLRLEINFMEPSLYICATPIGNLEDITLRVLKTLNEVDLIAAEDTRNTLRLLNHFDIKTSMTSYHEFNKFDKAYELVDKMKSGTKIALVTDAGTPAISDPGEVIVRLALEAGLTVTSLPGACAAVTALSMSGQKTRRFAFEAFLPPDKKERAEILETLKKEYRTTIIYEAPHHLKATLNELLKNLGDRSLTICREISKIHEEVRLTTLSEAIEYYSQNEPRGEFVLCLAGADKEADKQAEKESWEKLSIEEHMKLYLGQGMDKKDAMKQVAKDRMVSKREIYNALIK